MADAAYDAWQRDRAAGLASILIAESSAMVTTLNQHARADLILAGAVDARTETRLHDNTEASAGETVIPRRNDRSQRVGRGWVRNGSPWTITAVGAEGSLQVRTAGRRWGASLRLPSEHVAAYLNPKTLRRYKPEQTLGLLTAADREPVGRDCSGISVSGFGCSCGPTCRRTSCSARCARDAG